MAFEKGLKEVRELVLSIRGEESSSQREPKGRSQAGAWRVGWGGAAQSREVQASVAGAEPVRRS